MIQISEACVRYKEVSVFRRLNVEIKRGTLACITGLSGCGKSSLLHAVLGIVPLAEGQIRIGGEHLTEETVFSLRRKFAWLPQEIALPCEWVKEMVQLPFSLKAAHKRSFPEERFLELMTELNMDHSLYPKRVNEISGGQRQRFMIASAVLLERPFLLIDEPTSALDRESVTQVVSLLQKVARQGKTVLAVSHDAGFIGSCDQVIRLPEG